MFNCMLKHTCFFILLSLFVGLGHGRWKPSRESLERDIEVYRKMTKKMKQEFKKYYREHSNGPFGTYYSKKDKYNEGNIDFDGRNNTNFVENNLFNGSSCNETKLNKSYNVKFSEKMSHKEILKNKTILSLNKMWPKFEEILLAIGKKYDWKNDRWIKVKHKDKILTKLINDNNNNNVHHQKHNFIYRIVKLNVAKSKRNVIAVTAVR